MRGAHIHREQRQDTADRRDTAGGYGTNGMEAKGGGTNARRDVGGSEGRRERGAGGGRDLSSVLITR